MYKFSHVPDSVPNSAFRTDSHVPLFTYIQRGHSAESTEKRIFKIRQLKAKKYAFEVCKLCTFSWLEDAPFWSQYKSTAWQWSTNRFYCCCFIFLFISPYFFFLRAVPVKKGTEFLEPPGSRLIFLLDPKSGSPKVMSLGGGRLGVESVLPCA